MVRSGMAGLAVLLMAAGVEAQTRTEVFPNKVQIRSTATDALALLGGVSAAGIIESANSLRNTAANPLIYLIESDAAANTKRWRLNVDGGVFSVIVEDDAASPDAAMQISRSTGTGGQVRFKNGTAGAPSISFINDTDTGFYFSSNSVYTAVDGATVTRTYRGTSTSFSVEGGAFGAGAVQGARLDLGRNSSNNGAPGCVAFIDKAGATQNVWPDSSGNLRITSGLGQCPTESGGDTTGTVVGTQTSARASKDILYQVPAVTGAPAAMAILRSTPVYAFTYKNGAYNGETFFGITTDDSPLFGMDGGKSFNPVTAFGATVLALQDLDARLRALEARR